MAQYAAHARLECLVALGELDGDVQALSGRHPVRDPLAVPVVFVALGAAVPIVLLPVVAIVLVAIVAIVLVAVVVVVLVALLLVTVVLVAVRWLRRAWSRT